MGLGKSEKSSTFLNVWCLAIFRKSAAVGCIIAFIIGYKYGMINTGMI